MITRRFFTEGYRGAEPLRCVVEVGDAGAKVKILRSTGFGCDVFSELANPHAEVVPVEGGGRHLFRSGSPPVWWVRLSGDGPGQPCDLKCRSRFDAESMARACDRASGRERKK